MYCLFQDTVTYEMTHRLPYLEMCINESLRVYPPAVRYVQL